MRLTENGHDDIVLENLDGAVRDKVESVEQIASVNDRVARWRMGRLELQRQSPQTPRTRTCTRIYQMLRWRDTRAVGCRVADACKTPPYFSTLRNRDHMDGCGNWHAGSQDTDLNSRVPISTSVALRDCDHNPPTLQADRQTDRRHARSINATCYGIQQHAKILQHSRVAESQKFVRGDV